MESTTQIRLVGAVAVVLLPLLAGYIFPEQLWGMHFLLFVNDWQAAGFMLIGALTFWLASSETLSENVSLSPQDDEIIWKRLRLVFPLLAGAFAVSSPIVFDTYGDSFSIIPHFSEKVTGWSSQMTSELLSLNLTYPKIGEQTFYSVCFLLSWIFDTTPQTALKYLEVVCIILSVYFWTYLIGQTTRNLALRSALTVAGVLAPFTIVFHAHTEMYALPYAFILGYLAYCRFTFNHGSKPKHLVRLVILFILGVKLHIFCTLLFPILLMAFVNRTGLKEREGFKNYGHWALLLGGTCTVLFTYVFVTDSVNGTRVFTKDNLYDAVFLPIVASEGPPLDRYNLLSFSHVLDYLNMTYLWGGVLWGLAFMGSSGFISKLGESLYSKGLFLSFSAYALVFFVLNPLLSMPTDWDLFFFPGLVLMPLLLETISGVPPKVQSKLGLVIGLLALLNLPIWITHTNQAALSSRLALVGKHEFKTYWKGTSSTIKLASNLQVSDRQAPQLLESIETLRPYAVIGLDNEFAELLRTLASKKEIRDGANNRLKLLEEAYAYSPLLLSNTHDLCVEYSRTGQFLKAKPLVIELLKNEYPNPIKAANLGIYVFLMSNDLSSAINLCREAASRWPYQRKYIQLLPVLEAGDIDKAINLLRSS